MAIADKCTCEKQSKLIRNLLLKPPIVGQSWYLIDANWFKMWKKFVGFDEYNVSGVAEKDLFPGPIDNSQIIDANYELKPKLMEEMDYFLLPEQAWTILYEHYGISDENHIIMRYAIKYEENKIFTSIEIYLFKMKIGLNSDANLIKYKCSHENKMSNVLEEMKEIFEVKTNSECRLVGHYINKSNSKAPVEIPCSEDFTVRKAGLQANMTIILEVKTNAGKWDSIKPILNGSQTKVSTQNHKMSPGLCGITNLGNTCFMNSAIQCLSNVPELTSYFLNKKWEADINEDNPLGCQGRIAASYSKLIKEMWCGRKNDIIPRDFKYTVGMYAPMFNGYSQHDCHELMAFVMDSLHEDLNRIKKKPYIEEKDANNRPDEVVAREAWANYKLRNDSIIVDTFHGLLKSTLVCLECSKMSVKFDPFCYLSLPCPDVSDRNISVIFIYRDPERSYAKFDLLIHKNVTIGDLYCRVSNLTGISPNKMLGKDVYRNKFTRTLRINSYINSISQNEDVYLYETSQDTNLEDGDILMLGVYFKMEKYYTYLTYEEFSLPLIIEVPIKEFTFANIYKIILRRISFLLRKNELQQHTNYDDSNKIDTDGEFTPDAPLFTVHIKGKTCKEYQLNEDDLLGEIVGHDCLISVNWSQANKDQYFDTEEAKKFEVIPNCNNNEERTPLKLTDCIDLFTSREQLSENDPWYCPQCKKLQQATKKFDLWNLPNVLIFQLKRFRSHGVWRNKIDSNIDFPTRDLDLSEHVSGTSSTEKYDLIAVANHSGSLNGGHYTARAINQPTGLWFDFNDSYCWEINEDKVITKQAYILVYKKQSLL